MKKNVLIICGGGGEEHDISLTSAKYLLQQLSKVQEFNVLDMEITKSGKRINQAGDELELRRAGELVWKSSGESEKIDFFIPCIHGPPGENGMIQGLFEMMGVPYLGCGPEASQICFNKVTTKLWLEALGIPDTPWVFLDALDENNLKKAENFFDQQPDVFIKAASQGSSIGCYHVADKNDLQAKLKEASQYGPYILIEKTIKARELEVAVFETKEGVQASAPGEIVCPSQFYSFEEKYAQTSHTQTHAKAQDLTKEQAQKLQELALKAFHGLKLKHLARVDFFLTSEGEIYLNEINTFPGMTPISLFPAMVEASGLSFKTFLTDIIRQSCQIKDHS